MPTHTHYSNTYISLGGPSRRGEPPCSLVRVTGMGAWAIVKGTTWLRLWSGVVDTITTRTITHMHMNVLHIHKQTHTHYHTHTSKHKRLCTQMHSYTYAHTHLYLYAQLYARRLHSRLYSVFLLFCPIWHDFYFQTRRKFCIATWYGISLIMCGHLRCLPRFLAYWKVTNLPAPTKMRKFNEEQRKFIVRIFAIQSSATQVRREFLHHYGTKGGRKRSPSTAKDFERVNHHSDITGSVHETSKNVRERKELEKTRKNWRWYWTTSNSFQ